MQYILLIFGLIGLFTTVLAVSTTSGELPHALEVMQYTGSLGGHDVQLNGTVQEIFTQMQVLYPDFVPGYPGFSTGVDKNLASRAALNKDGYICCPVPGQPWHEGADTTRTEQGIAYLSHLGRIIIPANVCNRISCSYDSAIFLCNDNPYAINPAAIYIASYARDLLNDCEININSPTQPTTCGQEFDSDHYSVIVRMDPC